MALFNIQNLGAAKTSFVASPSTGAALCSVGFHGQVCSCKVIGYSPIRQAASFIGALLVSVHEKSVFYAIQPQSLAGHFTKVLLLRVLNSALGSAGFRQPILSLQIFSKAVLSPKAPSWFQPKKQRLPSGIMFQRTANKGINRNKLQAFVGTGGFWSSCRLVSLACN